MKLLWLASWYPNKLSPFNGDFIKRHAEAVSLYEDVHVIHVVRDEKGTVTKNIWIEDSVNGRLTETIIYYYRAAISLSAFNKFFSEKKYRGSFKAAVKKYFQEKGRPDLVHVHVGMKAGSIALWIKRKWEIPFVVSEHWSGFLNEAKEKFSDMPFYLRSLWKKVILNASACSAVSQYLAESIKKEFHLTSCKVIPNVVNTNIFYPVEKNKRAAPTFIHISGLDEWKNPHHILKAFQVVVKKYPDSHLEIFGSQRKNIVDLAYAMNLQDHVSFHDEVPQSILAENIRNSDALILYSSFETFGCVVIEANACGIPVIVSDIPVFHETVRNNENGFFSMANDPSDLADKMIAIIENKSLFNSSLIAGNTKSKYSYETVGKQMGEIYNITLFQT